MKKFTENDIFINTIKTYPKVRFFVHSGSIVYNDTNHTGALLNDFLMEPIAQQAVPAGTLMTEDGQYLVTEDGTFLIIE